MFWYRWNAGRFSDNLVIIKSQIHLLKTYYLSTNMDITVLFVDRLTGTNIQKNKIKVNEWLIKTAQDFWADWKTYQLAKKLHSLLTMFKSVFTIHLEEKVSKGLSCIIMEPAALSYLALDSMLISFGLSSFNSRKFSLHQCT